MAKNTYLWTIESKKQTKQTEQRQNHGYEECFHSCQIGRGRGGMGDWWGDEEVQIGGYRIAVGM